MKKICCAILAVLCILPCLAGCGKKDKYIEYRITLSDDLTQPGTITMQFYDYYFDMEKVSIEDVQTFANSSAAIASVSKETPVTPSVTTNCPFSRVTVAF